MGNVPVFFFSFSWLCLGCFFSLWHAHEKKNSVSSVPEWCASPLPPAQRAYGVHVNWGIHKGKEKLLWGAGKTAVVRDVENLSQTELFTEHKGKVNVVAMSPNGSWYGSSARCPCLCVFWSRC